MNEARVHEKAKQQLEKLVSQLQDTERTLKSKVKAVKQDQVESEIQIKALREQNVRLEAEKKYLEIDLQKKAKQGYGDAKLGTTAVTNEDLVRQLRIENNELRIRLEEQSALGVPVRTSIMGSFGGGNLPISSFSQRKDSVVSNGGGTFGALQLSPQNALNVSQAVPTHEDYFNRTPNRRNEPMTET